MPLPIIAPGHQRIVPHTVRPSGTPQQRALMRFEAAQQAVQRMLGSGDGDGPDFRMAQASTTQAVKELKPLATANHSRKKHVGGAIAMALLATTQLDLARAAEKLGPVAEESERAALRRAARMLAKAHEQARKAR